LFRDLRRVSVSDALLATAAHRRAQHHVERLVAYRADPAPLYARDRHVQHVRPAGDVSATRLEQGRIAIGHDVFGAVWRRGNLIPSGRPTRTGPAVEGQVAAGMRVALAPKKPRLDKTQPYSGTRKRYR